MIRINLLPHRQIKRAERQRMFNFMLAGVAIAGVAIVLLGQTIISAKIEGQNDRNHRLDTAIAKLDKEIEEIKQLKEQISNVLARKQVVENLQSNRSQSAILLDELSRQLPDGIYFNSVKQQGNQISINGIADSNARIAGLVRNFSSSQWLENPGLVEIKAVTINNLKQNDFTMTVKLKSQKASEESGADIRAKKP